MKISKAQYRCDLEAARQEGKHLLLGLIVKHNYVVYNAKAGRAASMDLPVHNTDEGIDRVITELESYSDTAPTEER